MYYMEKWSPGLSYIFVTLAPTALIVSHSHSEIPCAFWYFCLTSIYFRNMFRALTGEESKSSWSLPSPASLGTRVEGAAANSTVLGAFGNSLASAPSFRVHVSICWLQQYCPTWCRGNTSFVFTKSSTDIKIKSVFSKARLSHI